MTRTLRPAPEGAGDWAAAPTLRGAVLKLALVAGLAATLVIGATRPVPMLFLLLAGLCTALSGLSLMLALLRQEPARLRIYSHWHEAAALGLVGLGSHLAQLALR
ncbi:MAG TPA: hypothetical protein VMA53_02625 [Stellaceae bacterium]|nr:hypothetical protein [Stellaceae bacterium]